MVSESLIKETKRVLEDYLLTIYRLEELYGIARTTCIARELGVKPATVTKMLVKLVKQGLVEWVPYKGAKLTQRGREIAEKIVRKHRIAEYFFYKFLGFDMVKSHLYAHMLEHLPDEVFEKLYEVLGRPSRCPHGNPIPGAEVPKEIIEALSIDSFEPGSLVKIIRIVCASAADILRELESNRITPNQVLCIEEIGRNRVVLKMDSPDKRIILRGVLVKAVKAIKIGSC